MPDIIVIGTTSVYDYENPSAPLIIMALHQEVRQPDDGETLDDCIFEAEESIKESLQVILTPYISEKDESVAREMVTWALHHFSFYPLERPTFLFNDYNRLVAQVFKEAVDQTYQTVYRFKQTEIEETRKRNHKRGMYDEERIQPTSGVYSRKFDTQALPFKAIILISPVNLGHPNKPIFPLASPTIVSNVLQSFRNGAHGPLPPTKCVWIAEDSEISLKADSIYRPLYPSSRYINPKYRTFRDSELAPIRNFFYTPTQINRMMSYLEKDWLAHGLKDQDMAIIDPPRQKKQRKSIAELLREKQSSNNEEESVSVSTEKRASLINFIVGNVPFRPRTHSLPVDKTQEEPELDQRTVLSLNDKEKTPSLRRSFVERFLSKKSTVLPTTADAASLLDSRKNSEGGSSGISTLTEEKPIGRKDSDAGSSGISGLSGNSSTNGRRDSQLSSDSSGRRDSGKRRSAGVNMLTPEEQEQLKRTALWGIKETVSKPQKETTAPTKLKSVVNKVTLALRLKKSAKSYPEELLDDERDIKFTELPLLLTGDVHDPRAPVLDSSSSSGSPRENLSHDSSSDEDDNESIVSGDSQEYNHSI